mmetsp:Transcript_3984/g.8815  ORF Transcript_3984/g.8815 Transcript_3984/m.8815 type:complete len:239 (+) Transcript_3984:86-802(+)
MTGKSLTIAFLASHRALSFSPIVRVSFPAATANSPFSSRSVISPPTRLKESNQDGPHLHTRPLPPPMTSAAAPNLLQKVCLKLGLAKNLRERVVHKYFHGVDTKNIPQIVECFQPDGAIIRDVCSLTNRDVSYEDVGKMVTPEFLGERCREFLAAHPDANVMFHYSPTCGRGRGNRWVFAHWYETGTWSGSSEGIEPDGSPLTVQGQTRFLVDDDLKIKEIVITRTFSRWEEMLLKGK